MGYDSGHPFYRERLMMSITKADGQVVSRRLLDGPWTDYLLLIALAFAPWILAHSDGVFTARQMASSGISAIQPADRAYVCIQDNKVLDHKVCAVPQPSGCIDYFHRPNWSFMFLELPLALLALRTTARWLFLYDKRKMAAIPDLIDPPSKIRTRESLQQAALNGWNFVFAFVVDVGLHLFDLRDTVSMYAHRLALMYPALSHARMVPHAWYRWPISWLLHYVEPHVGMPEWDWATYFLGTNKPGDYIKNLILVMVAYPCQFLMGLFAIYLLVILFRHNLYFLQSIYVRSRKGANDPKDFIVLRFDDPDRRLGLGGLSGRFDLQMLMLIVAGALTLLSRYQNSNTELIYDYIGKLKGEDFINPAKVLLGPQYHWRNLFPTPGQMIFPAVWLILFLIVMMPALVKCLPLRPFTWTKRKPGVMAFLSQFTTEDATAAAALDDAEVTRRAEQFARQSFWPVGDTAAQSLSILCFFMIAVMIVPIWPATLNRFYFLLEVLVVSYTLSQSLFWVLGYVLSIVDRRLISKP